jgi:hypothetical protein
MERQRPSSPGRLLAAAVAVFLAAVIEARLLLTPGLAPVALLLLPLAAVALSFAFGLLRAVVLLALFAATVLAFRFVLDFQGPGLLVVFLTPALVLAGVLGTRVLLLLLRSRRKETGGKGEGERQEEERRPA